MEKHELNLDGIGENGEGVKTNTKTDFVSETKLTKEEILDRKKKSFGYELIGSKVEEVIKDFVEHIEENKEYGDYYCEFDGEKIYSVDLLVISKNRGCDLEEAFYIKHYGKTKIEMQKKREEGCRNKEIERKRRELEALEKFSGWIEEGKKYIDESKWKDREDYVNNRARDRYCGKDVEDTIILLRLIEEGKSWQEIQEKFDKNCKSNYYRSIVRNRVICYSKKGEEVKKELKLR